jgi:Ca2+-binding EF-hand superfamily protein
MLKVNKNLMTIGIIGAISATLLLTAMESQAKGNRKGAKSTLAAAFNRLDADGDGDGLLSLDEMLTPALNRAENEFIKKDSDADSFLTFDEWTGDNERVDPSVIADEIVQCVADIKAETGNDNIVVPDPGLFLSALDKFDNADTSGDGVLDLSEVQAAVTSKVETRFSHMDTVLSADVSLDEFTDHKMRYHSSRRAVKSCIDELSEEELF